MTRPTLNEIASTTGVSAGTVSRVLNGRMAGRISERTRKLVLDAANEAGYRPNAAARSMLEGRTRTIGIVFHNDGHGRDAHPHTFEFVVGINSVLEPAGYTSALVQLTDVESDTYGMGRVFREHALDGMIVLAPLIKPVREALGNLVQWLIWCDAGKRDSTGCLWRDEVAAGRLAGEAMVAAGYRRLIFIRSHVDGRRAYHHAQEREHGVRAAAEAAGVPFETLAFDHEAVSGWHGLPEAAAGGAAVIASDYPHVLELHAAAAASGIVLGRDCGFASCDDLDLFRRFYPNLPRAGFDRAEMGKRAADMMLERIKHPDGDASLPSFISQPTWLAGTVPAGPTNT
ncbi:MAG: LacI family DNA-binding transcriptional regulator [Phycisphaerae bacterium]